jgi:hypothetical protein
MAEGSTEKWIMIVKYGSASTKFMIELCVTPANIEEWLQRAKASEEQIEPLSLTEDARFTLEHRSFEQNAGCLAPFVCYDNYCEMVETAKNVESVVDENS